MNTEGMFTVPAEWSFEDEQGEYEFLSLSTSSGK